jgi:hypothetical protein
LVHYFFFKRAFSFFRILCIAQFALLERERGRERGREGGREE